MLALVMLSCLGNAPLAAETPDESAEQNLGTQTSQNLSVHPVTKVNKNGESVVVFKDVVEYGALYTLNAKIGEVCADLTHQKQETKINVKWYRDVLLTAQTAYEQKRSELFPTWTDDGLSKLLYGVAISRDYSANRFELYKVLYSNEIRASLDKYRLDQKYKCEVDAFSVLHYRYKKAMQLLDEAEKSLETVTSDLDFFHEMPSDIQLFLTALSEKPSIIQVHISDENGSSPYFTRNYYSSDTTDRTALEALTNKYQHVYPFVERFYFEDEVLLTDLENLLSTCIPQIDRTKLHTTSETEVVPNDWTVWQQN